MTSRSTAIGAAQHPPGIELWELGQGFQELHLVALAHICILPSGETWRWKAGKGRKSWLCSLSIVPTSTASYQSLDFLEIKHVNSIALRVSFFPPEDNTPLWKGGKGNLIFYFYLFFSYSQRMPFVCFLTSNWDPDVGRKRLLLTMSLYSLPSCFPIDKVQFLPPFSVWLAGSSENVSSDLKELPGRV